MVNSNSNQSSETIKSVLKSKTKPTENMLGVKSLKLLRVGRVLIGVASVDETKLLNADINTKCVKALEANVPILRKLRLIIRNIPQDMTV